MRYSGSNENDFTESTDQIRTLKHSDKIRESVTEMVFIKKKYARLQQSNPTQFNTMCQSKCDFLYNNYTDIYNRVKSGHIDMEMLNTFLNVLKEIEDGRLDQHEASFKVGKILKQMYVDSALNNTNKSNKKKKKTINREKPISWQQFKSRHLEEYKNQYDNNDQSSTPVSDQETDVIDL